jgi:predicted alpha-1,2-mannosidase
MNRYADFMNGEPAIPAIVDGYCRGLVDTADVQPLYDQMRYRALVERRDPSYLTYGYVPNDISGSGASDTQEHAIADFALALMADRLGLSADRDALRESSKSWRNLFDSQTRFVRPRLANGQWVDPFDPTMPEGYREGTGWQYLWLEPHDVRGLADRIGGDAATIERLDTFFLSALAEPVPYVAPEAQKHASLFGIAYYGNQFTPANETDLQAPYLYNYVGQPWKTQALIRGMQGLYRPAPDGMPGNDDLGTMSAWFVWSALGFYPETPGAPVYVIGSPMFERASIRVPGGTFDVVAPGASPAGKYVQSASLNGSALPRTWFTHSSMSAGGNLTVSMGPTATTWGASGAPPSLTTHENQLSAFGCSG